MNKDTLEKLKELKLYGMYNAFKASLENYWCAASGTSGITGMSIT